METKIKLRRPAESGNKITWSESNVLAYGEPAFEYFAGKGALYIGTGSDTDPKALFKETVTTLPGDLPKVLSSGTSAPTGTGVQGQIYIQYID